MLDPEIRKHLNPILDMITVLIAKTGLNANQVTVLGFAFGGVGAACLLSQNYMAALGFLAVNRLCDGIDGTLARLQKTDQSGFGGFLDIVLDMIIYGAWPLCFALGLGDMTSLSAAGVLLLCYMATATSFLALSSILSAKGQKADDAKSLIFGRAIAEGSETIAYMVLICLLPAWFVPITYGYACLCVLTVIQRSLQARKQL